MIFLNLSWVIKGCPLYPNNPSKTDLGRNGCSYIRMIFLNLSWVIKGCPLYPNNLSKSLLGHKRLHTQTNALAKQSLKDRLLLYADHKVD